MSPSFFFQKLFFACVLCLATATPLVGHAGGSTTDHGGDMDLLYDRASLDNPEFLEELKKDYINATQSGTLKADLIAFVENATPEMFRDLKSYEQLQTIKGAGLVEDIRLAPYVLGSTCKDAKGKEHSISTAQGTAKKPLIGAKICVNVGRLALQTRMRNDSSLSLAGLFLHDHARHFGIDDADHTFALQMNRAFGAFHHISANHDRHVMINRNPNLFVRVSLSGDGCENIKTLNASIRVHGASPGRNYDGKDQDITVGQITPVSLLVNNPYGDEPSYQPYSGRFFVSFENPAAFAYRPYKTLMHNELTLHQLGCAVKTEVFDMYGVKKFETTTGSVEITGHNPRR